MPKLTVYSDLHRAAKVSVLFNESKLPKCCELDEENTRSTRFSTLQRVEIAEIWINSPIQQSGRRFQYSSTSRNCRNARRGSIGAGGHLRFSTLQRVEIAEIERCDGIGGAEDAFQYSSTSRNCRNRQIDPHELPQRPFQYSSTSRNCRNSTTDRRG